MVDADLSNARSNALFDLEFVPADEAPSLKSIFSDALEGKSAALQEWVAGALQEKAEVIVDLGLEANGASMGLSGEEFQEFLSALSKAANHLDADLSILRLFAEERGSHAQVLLRRRLSVEDVVETRVAVVGNVDAGKSTMLGVLTKGILDDGRGLARTALFRHKHEIESGRTSSVSYEILGFTSGGKAHHEAHPSSSKQSWAEICESSSKIVSFIDLAGHEKYLKTTVFGMTACQPDYVMLMIGANQGIVGMTKEHLGLALALNVPFFIVVTKIDMCPANILQETLKDILKLIKSPGCRKIPKFVESMNDVIECSSNLATDRLCPIFQVSNVTGQSLDLLERFLDLLPPLRTYDPNALVEFHIEDIFTVPGVGTVVSGLLIGGTVHVGDVLSLGPDSLGAFQSVQVKSIHRKRCSVSQATAGQAACFALRKIKKAQVRKGMVLLQKEANATACWEFEAEVRVLFHSTTISPRYQAIVHCESVRQTASIVSFDGTKDCLRTGDRAIVRFRFIKYPEYMKPGSKLVFREGRTKGMGKVTRVFELHKQGVT